MTAPSRQPFRLTPQQYQLLMRPLDPKRIGKNPQGFSHLEAWDVRRWLIRVFGVGGFDIETVSLDLVKEIQGAPRRKKNKQGVEYGDPYVPWTVVYRAQVRLTIWDQYGGHVVLEDGACGDSTNQPSIGDCHDNAAKTALSQALKRCAVNLGDCFGLSLYNNGALKPVVVKSAIAPDDDAEPVLQVDDAPVQPEPGTEPAGEEARPVSAPPAVQQPAAEPAAVAPDPLQIRDWALGKDRTADGISNALTKLLQEHPAVAATRLTNEHGDEEELRLLLDRRARELTRGGLTDNDRRRKRMHALCNELGMGGISGRPKRLELISRVVGTQVASSNDIDDAQVEQVIGVLESQQRQQPQARRSGRNQRTAAAA